MTVVGLEQLISVMYSAVVFSLGVSHFLGDRGITETFQKEKKKSKRCGAAEELRKRALTVSCLNRENRYRAR